MLHDSSSVREGSEGKTLAAAANQALRDVPGSCCYGNDWLGPCQDKPKFLHLRTHPLTRQHNTQSCMGNAGRDLNSCEQIVNCIHYRPLNTSTLFFKLYTICMCCGHARHIYTYMYICIDLKHSLGCTYYNACSVHSSMFNLFYSLHIFIY